MERSSNWLCVPASTFCVRTHPVTTRGGVWFEVGWAGHIRGVVLADVLVGLVFGVVFAIFGVVHVCWPSTERWWVPMAFGGASWPFSFLDVRWCEGMVGDGEGDEERGNV